ncbi:hypothetical protein [Rhodopseudomonas palustris]|uniref:Uncharacterized protein n=2 Tax=Rhodopseudomonas palustris TaxID=1076 RepID=A0AAE9Y4J8_RHOPA|nr:hypothetical protein [Rhodopseudomonas palustris]WAB75985.1 hypothetical protein OR798_15915 [Rhodopseudomonas palustris]WCL93240.1 hypothetical protein TX73_015910 [Rhodopseudomonas palustris CGA009]WND49895.1 hypothetical protein L1A21_15845 [Rhodopseudomonas palustris]
MAKTSVRFLVCVCSSNLRTIEAGCGCGPLISQVTAGLDGPIARKKPAFLERKYRSLINRMRNNHPLCW